jgi:hypothetical protein
MSETINIRRYKLAYSGVHDGEVRRLKLRPVQGSGGSGGCPAAAAEAARPATPGAQRSVAMYASPART